MTWKTHLDRKLDTRQYKNRCKISKEMLCVCVYMYIYINKILILFDEQLINENVPICTYENT